MLDSLPPGTSPPTDIVTQKIFLNGTVLGTNVPVVQITVNKTFNKISSAKVIFQDGSAGARDFPLSDSDAYKPGSEIIIQLGYHGQVDQVFAGIITKHAIKVKDSGSSFLIIEAKDKAITLTGNRKSAYYVNQTDSDIMNTLAAAFQPNIDDTTPTFSQLVQFDATDWDFLLTRAEANGMLVLTDDGTINVNVPSTGGSVVLTTTYGQDMFEFDAEMDARLQIAGVTSLSWDYTQQQLEQSNQGAAQFTEAGNISSADLGNVLGAQLQLNHPGHLEQTQLQNWSNAYAMHNHLSKAVGRVRIQGNAAIKPGVMITLAGVGDRFNGNVFVTGVLHNYDGNWKTDVQFGWNEEWFYKKDEVMDKPVGGLLPGVNGLRIGVVLDIDDSQVGQYRVQVHIPTFTSGNQGIWARVATLDAGANRGSYFRPQTGDEVVLGFLDDDPREPILLGYLHSSSSKQVPSVFGIGSQQYGFATKSNISLIFDDGNVRLTAQAPSGGGFKSLVLNDSSGAITISDENQNSIQMDASGITISSNSNITLSSPSGTVNITGGMVNINS